MADLLAEEGESDGEREGAEGAVGADGGGEGEYVPIKRRRMLEQQTRLARLGDKAGAAAAEAALKAGAMAARAQAREGAARGEGGHAGAQGAGADEGNERDAHTSLLLKAAKLREVAPMETPAQKLLREENELFKEVTEKRALMSAQELAHDVKYDKALDTGWRPPSKFRGMTEGDHQAVRDKFYILTEGKRLPPPIQRFEDMRFPPSIMSALKERGILRPTPIQMQALPSILSGRDTIGIAFTGSGKSLAFILPMVMTALQGERALPLEEGEGPFGMVVCPSRELARQSEEIVRHFAEHLVKEGMPELRCMLCIGGMDAREQSDVVRRGVHCVVATPGRLKDLLIKRRMNLDVCKYFCLDEADRMLDIGFEDDIREIFTFFKSQRQTILFSATMPEKIHKFAETALVDPIVVNVGRAGAANLDVIQEIEYVKEEAKITHILECLQKSPPPVLVFAEKTGVVDNIHEYLLLKGIEAVAIHGAKDQEDRSAAIDAFKAGKADVLVATDVAGKGLDFPNISHVINYELPAEIENYVHRIGRTGRAGKTGIATTFINKNQSETILLDLKHLLQEAKQRIPPVLMMLEDPNDISHEMVALGGHKGCLFCGGLGHRIHQCPKLANETEQRVAGAARRDFFGADGYGGEM